MKPQKLLARGAGWVLVLADSASREERAAYGFAQDSRAVAALITPRIQSEVCEVLYAIHLNGAHRVIGLTEVARGGLHGISVSARDVFRAACAQGASAIVLAHNHPSGDPRPSTEDLAFTRTVCAAGDALGIRILDHVVVASTGAYRSMLDDGVMP